MTGRQKIDDPSIDMLNISIANSIELGQLKTLFLSGFFLHFSHPSNAKQFDITM